MDTARETSRHDHKTWGLGSLRSKPVTFISAGDSEPLKQLEDLLQHDVKVQMQKSPPKVPKTAMSEQKTQACEPSIQANRSVTSRMDKETAKPTGAITPGLPQTASAATAPCLL